MIAGCSGSSSDPSPNPTPTTASAAARWDSASSTSADATALKTLRTWSRPDEPYDVWWRDLKPLLSPEAQQAYADTDPAQIPRLRLTGVKDRIHDDNPHLATVQINTDQGVFGVDLSRRDGRATWTVESIVFPGGQSVFQ